MILPLPFRFVAMAKSPGVVHDHPTDLSAFLIEHKALGANRSSRDPIAIAFASKSL